jgi:hypothetical protein
MPWGRGEVAGGGVLKTFYGQGVDRNILPCYNYAIRRNESKEKRGGVYIERATYEVW